MNALLNPIVAVVVCLAGAVCFAAAAQIHAMAPADLGTTDIHELSARGRTGGRTPGVVRTRFLDSVKIA